jgi:hypothetical protein
MAGVVHIPWYATAFRQETFAEKVVEIAPLALRYGATRFAVHRSLDDRYKLLQMSWFESKNDWYRYWDGPEMSRFRIDNQGHFQIPVAYVWHEELTAAELVLNGGVEPAPEPAPAPQVTA